MGCCPSKVASNLETDRGPESSIRGTEQRDRCSGDEIEIIDLKSFDRFPLQFAGADLFYWVERGTARVKWLSQELNTVTRTRTNR